MKRMQIIRRFVSEMAKGTVLVVNDKDYCAFTGASEKYPMIGVPEYRLIAELKDSNIKIFRKDFVSRYSSARGFATITLVLAHEIGHIKTNSIYCPDEEAENAEKQMREDAETQEEYMKIPSEYGATEWAIEWLHDAEHRAIAKRFEKEFFNAG